MSAFTFDLLFLYYLHSGYHYNWGFFYNPHWDFLGYHSLMDYLLKLVVELDICNQIKNSER